MHDKGGDKYTNDKEKEADGDYIAFNKEGYEFVNEEKDKWICSLDGDVCFGKSLESGLELEDKWKINMNDDDDNVVFSVKSNNSFS